MHQQKTTRNISKVLYFLAIFSSIYIITQNLGFFVDDAYISFRYANNLLNGHGLVFNAYEKVEGYSNLLFILILSALKYIGIDYLAATRSVNIISGFFLIFTANNHILALRDTPHNIFIAALCSFLIASSYPFVLWTLSGMETVFFSCLIAIASIFIMEHLDQEKSKNSCFMAGILIALAILTRPEAILFAIPVIIMLFRQIFLYKDFYKRIKEAFYLGYFIIPVVVTYIALNLWRFAYYQDIFPNTYYAKLYGLSTLALINKGIAYIANFIAVPPFIIIFFLVFLPFAFNHKNTKQGNLLLIANICIYFAYIIYIGGDWMPVFRLMVVVIPLLIILCCRILMYNLGTESNKKYLFAAISIVLICASQGSNKHIQHKPHLAFIKNYWEKVAEFINKSWPEDSIIAINMAGFIPYLTPNHYYIDMLGINDKYIARRKNLPFGHVLNFRPGHMKGDGRYILSRRPDYIIPGAGFENNASQNGIFISEKELFALEDFSKLYTKKTVPITIDMTKSSKIKTHLKKRTALFSYYVLKAIEHDAIQN